MTTLDEIQYETQQNAMDSIEEALAATGWACDRGEETVIHCATTTRYGDCGGMFVWREEPAAIHFSLSLDLKGTKVREQAIATLLREINERLWLGHFDYWIEDGIAVFRHTIPMQDRVAPEKGEILAILNTAKDAAEQFLPAFNFVVWAGQSPKEAMAAVLFETIGEA